MTKLTLRQFDLERERILGLMRAEALPFADNSAQARQVRKEQCRYSILEFAKTYMPHYVGGEFSEYHETLEGYCFVTNEPVFTSGPKESGKSVLITIVDCVHAKLYKRRHFTIIGGKTEDQAADRAAYIQFELEYNERIIADFGHQKGSWLWERKDFVLKNGTRVKARGLGQQVIGLLHRQYRPDGFRGEDLEDEQSVKNPKRTKELELWIKEVVLGGMGPNFSCVWAGNIISKNCALYRLINEKDDDGKKHFKGKIFKLLQDDGTSLVPGIWPVERIENMKKILGPVSFNKVYQNDPVDPDARFRAEWFKTCKTKDALKKNLLIKVYTDPMVKPTPTSDSAAIICAGIDLDQLRNPEYRRPADVYWIDAVIRKLTRQQMVNWHYIFDAKWHPVEHWFEKVAFSEWLMGDFELAAKGKHRLNVRAYEQKRIHKDLRVETLTGPAEQGSFYFCTENNDIPKLMEHFLYYGNPGVPKDGPDACASLYDILNHSGPMMYVFED